MASNQQYAFSLNIPVTRIYNFLKLVIVINILFLAGTWLHAEKVIFPDSVTAQWWLAQFNFGKENVLAAWYSSMLMFCIGLAAALCFWADMRRTENKAGRILNYGWLVMAGIFIVLSFDEMGSFHEMLSQTPLFKKAGGGQGKLVFFALIGAVAIFMAVFFFTKFKTNKLALLLTIFGLLLFLSNPFQEKFEIESWRNSADPDSWHRPFFFLLLEEGSEIFASFCFLFSFITYAINTGDDNKVLKLTSPAGKSFIVWPAALAAALGIIMLVVRSNAWNLKGDDNGVPQDWPPAATAFTCFALSLYLFFKKGFESNRFVYASIAIISLFTSAYFGSYMYGYWEGPFEKMPFVLLGLVALCGLLAVIKLKDIFAKLFFAGWVALVIFSCFKKEFASAFYGYAGIASLMLGLFRHYQSEAETAGS